MASAKFVPIISPVREQLRGLRRALQAVSLAGGQAVLIVNPEHGELADNGTESQGRNVNLVRLINEGVSSCCQLPLRTFTEAKTTDQC